MQCIKAWKIAKTKQLTIIHLMGQSSTYIKRVVPGELKLAQLPEI
jgi:phosphoheptose isomerase